MTAIALNPARRAPSRPSSLAAWRWERRKTSARWYWPLAVVLCAVGQAAGWSQYMSYRDEFRAESVTWEVLWGQASLLPSMIFIPLAVAALVAQVASVEHDNRIWQRMEATGLAGAMVRGKLLHTLEVAVGTTATFVAEFVGVGLALGFDPAKLGPYLVRMVPVSLSLWAIALLVAWMGVRLSSFAGVMTTVLVATMAGFAFSLVAPPLAALYPMSLMTSAFSSRSMGSIASMGSLLATSAIALAWAGIWAAALRRAARSQE